MAKESPMMIEARGLSKYYGEFAAIDNVTFSIPSGKVVAFLGPNGAGKSTTMKILTGFLNPSKGQALIGGFDVHENRIAAAKLIGYLPENGPLYLDMSPKALLRHVGEVRGLSQSYIRERLDYVAVRCDLTHVWGKPTGKLSRGYRQRVGMAQALLHDPKVLILDEPTSGLDPNQVHDVRELLKSLGETKTVILSTHILQEVEAVCSRVILINEGRIALDGTVADLYGPTHDMEGRFRQLTRAK